MKTEPNQQTSPTIEPFQGTWVPTGGLTKREMFAAMAMQGWLSNKDHPTHFLPEDDMQYCIKIADALIEALNKETK